MVVPNSDLINYPVLIRSAGVPTRFHVHFSVPAWVPPSRVINICRRVMRQGVPDILHDPAPTVSIIGVEAFSGSIKYDARYFTINFMRHGDIGSNVIERLWYALNREGIPMTSDVTNSMPISDELGDSGYSNMIRPTSASSIYPSSIGALSNVKERELWAPNSHILAEIPLFSGFNEASLQWVYSRGGGSRAVFTIGSV